MSPCWSWSPTSRFVLVILLLISVVPYAARAATQHRDGRGVTEVLGTLPLSFEANLGQAPRGVKFLARGAGYTVFLTDDGAIVTFPGGAWKDLVRVRLPRTPSPVAVTGEGDLPGKANYFRGNDPGKWTTNIPTYTLARYHDVSPGVDLLFHGQGGQLEFDFVVSAGHDVHKAAFTIDGAQQIRLDRTGDLVVSTRNRSLQFHRPVAYEVGGENKGELAPSGRRYLQASFLVDGSRIGFAVAHHDRSRTLVIDPSLSFSTYAGSSSDDFGTGIAVDSSGNTYLAGYTASADFPVTAGAFQTACGGGCATGAYDAFVMKLNPTGTALLYSTYLGGSNSDSAYGFYVDAAGHAYVTGETLSSDFPVTSGAYQTTCAGGCVNSDGFVTELNSTGSGLVYSTYLGGSGKERVNAIVVDGSGNAFLAGATQSTDFPVTAGVFQPTCKCSQSSDAFVAELNPGGSALVYASYLGGPGEDVAYSIALDSAGDAFLTGYSKSSTFPVTAGAFQTTLNAPIGAFVTKVSPTATSLVYSTYLGGSSPDTHRVCYACGVSVVVDANGNALVAGLTEEPDFPTTPGAYQTTLHGTSFGHDAFITNLNATGSGLLYSTFLGGGSDDGANSVAYDSSGNIYVRGNTLSSDFPVTDGAVQSTLAGGYDYFVAQFDPTLSTLQYSTYLGGSSDDFGMATHNLALDTQSPPNVYVAGWSYSSNFPTTSGAFQTSSHGGAEAVAVKLGPLVPAAQLSAPSLGFPTQLVGTTSSPQSVTVTNNGYTDLVVSSIVVGGANPGDFQQSNNCGTVKPSSSCTITVSFAPTAQGTRSATVTIFANATPAAQTITLSGTATVVSLSSTTLTFTPQKVGTTSSPQRVTLTNVGAGSLGITGITVSGANAGDFLQTSTCGKSLAPSASCSISVAFSPKATGHRTASVNISDSGGGSPQSISLSGTGQ
jgi:hypothetical protein